MSGEVCWDVTVTELPSGTVTLLFSDMESSTQMVHALGSAWAGVLDRQREICRAAWAAHDGHELGTEGDSFFVVFATADAAVSAALEAQHAFAEEPWPDGVTVRVRMGIHTGSPQRHADGYVGMDVHRAARVAAAAHGGQVLVSETTARLAEASLGETVRMVDLGEHQLKDIPSRMRICQVTAPGLASSFPAIKSLGAAGSLPTHLVGIVGREGELAELRTLMTNGVRLVTLTGPGGSGKTRLATALAAEVADLFSDGVFVVHLAGVTESTGIWAAVSQVLDVPADGQVPPGFFTYVAHKRVLLVLDNLEQIEDSDTVVRELLETAGHVAVVATSRRPLHVDGEHEYAVTPLSPTDAQSLFAQHAARVRRGFELTPENSGDVAAICAALDGLPLAIELVAARIKLLSPKAILGRIDQSLDLASADRSRDTRQATIRGAIAWSYDLLDPVHQTVLDHLGVFVGGATHQAIEAVVPATAIDGLDLADILFDLVDDSLVTVGDSADGEPRFGVLETVRRFAADRLTSTGQGEAAVGRHAQFYYDLARDLRKMSLSEYAAGRRIFSTELANISAMVSREPRTVSDPAGYSQPVPVAHVFALVVFNAFVYFHAGEIEGWFRRGTELAELDDDEVGRLALLAWIAFARSYEVDTDGCVLLFGRVWDEFDVDRGNHDMLPDWVRPADVAAQACFVAGWLEANRGSSRRPTSGESGWPVSRAGSWG